MLNLIWPPTEYLVPDITIKEAETGGPCRPVRIVIVGGSFMHDIGEIVSRRACGADIVEYEYWSAHRINWVDGEAILNAALDPARRDADLRAANVILYEENEQELGHATQGQGLYDWLRRRMADDGTGQ